MDFALKMMDFAPENGGFCPCKWWILPLKMVMFVRRKWHLGMFQTKYTPIERGFDEHMGYFQGCESAFTHIAACCSAGSPDSDQVMHIQLNTMNIPLEMMNFPLKRMNFVLKMMNFVFKMMDFNRYVKLCSAQCGETLFKTGDVGDKLYIVLRGEVEIDVSSKVREASVSVVKTMNYVFEMMNLF